MYRELGSDYDRNYLVHNHDCGDMQMKTYLGDAVYATFDKFGALVLTTENGIHATNTIVLEREVIDALLQYLKSKGIIK